MTTGTRRAPPGRVGRRDGRGTWRIPRRPPTFENGRPAPPCSVEHAGPGRVADGPITATERGPRGRTPRTAAGRPARSRQHANGGRGFEPHLRCGHPFAGAVAEPVAQASRSRRGGGARRSARPPRDGPSAAGRAGRNSPSRARDRARWSISGRAWIGPRTRAFVAWQIESAPHGSTVSLRAIVERAGLRDGLLLAFGGSWWLRRRFASALRCLAHQLAPGPAFVDGGDSVLLVSPSLACA
jgi:hypothetical protein